MPPLSQIFKSLSASHRLAALGPILLAAIVVPTQVTRYQERQRQQAMTAALHKRITALEKRNADLKKLSSEMERSAKEMKRLRAEGKVTAADTKRFEELYAQYQARWKNIAGRSQR